MYRRFIAVQGFAAAVMLAAAVACTSSAPLAPTPSPVADSGRADGSTLKVTAPGLASPGNNETLTNSRPTFAVNGSSGQFVPASVYYEFELQNDGGARIAGTVQQSTIWEFPDNLNPDTAYRWRVRATVDGFNGPWSSTGRFITGQALQVPNAFSSTDEWRDYFFALIAARGVGGTITLDAMYALRPELNAAGADWQNAWRGDARPRLFLPVPGCPPATGPNVPACSFNRTVDVGDFGRGWQWFPR
jgi:hypothetical protein